VKGRISRTVIVGVLLLLCACQDGSGDVPRSPAATDSDHASPAATDSDVVTFQTTDGVTLSGRLFGSRKSEAGIVLAHGATVNQSSWFAFAQELGHRGYLVLTFDFRGYCPGGDAGCSHGTKDPSSRPTDLHAALDEIRSFGVARLGVMGSSMGGSTALAVAADEGKALDLVVALSAQPSIGSVAIDAALLQRISAAKLFMAGNQDDGSAGFAQEFFDGSAEPKHLTLLDTNDHGAEMLRGSQREQARAAVFDWLDAHLPV
jgi:alpha-beta hydrolase superfamily lysophospholipase